MIGQILWGTDRPWVVGCLRIRGRWGWPPFPQVLWQAPPHWSRGSRSCPGLRPPPCTQRHLASPPEIHFHQSFEQITIGIKFFIFFCVWFCFIIIIIIFFFALRIKDCIKEHASDGIIKGCFVRIRLQIHYYQNNWTTLFRKKFYWNLGIKSGLEHICRLYFVRL